jgi:glycosyltransferase involved in cell wall biosynthesis
MLAAAHGHPVTFIERPLDVRVLRTASGAREWLCGFRGAPRAGSSVPNVHVVPQATLFPGHLNGLSEATSNLLLSRQLGRASDEAAVVVNVPWQWPATRSAHGRRVFDCADDWSELVAHRSARLTQLYRRIGREADAIIVANPSLAVHFPVDRTVVVRNGVSDDMLAPLAPAVKEPRLVHAGTLTPRFDADLAARVLEQLPDWSLELYGQCQYPGFQELPGPELSRLLSDYTPRVRWHGVVAREALSAAIDHAAVALVLNRPERSLGQDSMKLYDYAARGRPIVTTRFSPQLDESGPPHLRVVDDAREMAEGILASREEEASWPGDRRRWAEEQRWISRWADWGAAVFGALE